MNLVKTILLAFLFGLRDSFLGAISLFTIDKDSVGLTGSKSSSRKQEEENERYHRPPERRGQRQPLKKNDTRVAPMLIQCSMLNGGVFLLSMLVFETYLVPLVKYLAEKIFVILTNKSSQDSKVWTLIEPIMSYTFGSLWVVPLFWLSKILNSLWFLEIADAAYRRKHGRPLTSLLAARNESAFKYLSKLMSDLLFSIVVEIFFLLQAQVTSFIPVIGSSLAFVHMSLLYSLYAFEYTWANRGWTVVKRVSYIENHWPYFFGFGFLLASLSTISSTVISGCLFGVLFPLFILSGLEAKPVEDCDCPIRVFRFVIWLTNKTFIRSSTKTQVKPTQADRTSTASSELHDKFR
eukprot:gene11130-12301_t